MSENTRSHYWRGFRNGAPFVFVVAPFGMLFGVVATEAGMRLLDVMSFSVLVIAGAAQFAALQLMKDNAPVLIVLATALAVNMRMAMYSASITPHLGAQPLWKRAIMAYFLVDQTYAASIMEFERRPEMTLAQKTAYFFGVMSPVCLPWYGATWVGAALGTKIPPEFALDFAVPITFLAIITPMLRTAAHVAAAVVSIVVALAFAFLPYNLGLLIASVAAMVTGAQVEQWVARRAARREFA
ncbi:AzlC family ABC transporter permease [Acidimangrovimonas pyrenivorans]|uniref:AzlC family ABC transporter permease n=1 Tax=Acidimangrovimonas pyrenivorans TaxID=2030798 RepID=A0ABV7AC27_9RHOB